MQTRKSSTESLEDFTDKNINSHKTKNSKETQSNVQLTGESYRDTHNIGRRKSNASVVTYSLNSHLFFDVYAKFDQQDIIRINGASKAVRKKGRCLPEKIRVDAVPLQSPTSGDMSTDTMSNNDYPSHQSSPRKLHVLCDALPVQEDETLIPSPKLDAASPFKSPRKKRTFPIISTSQMSTTTDHSDWGDVPPTITETFQRILDNKTVFKKHLSRTTVRKTAVKSKTRSKVRRKAMMRLCKVVKQSSKVYSEDDDDDKEEINCQIILAKRNGVSRARSNFRPKTKKIEIESPSAPRERRMASLNAAAIINCVQSFLVDGRNSRSKSDTPMEEIEEEDIRLELVTDLDREEECADGDCFIAMAYKSDEVIDGTENREGIDEDCYSAKERLVTREQVKDVKRRYSIAKKIKSCDRDVDDVDKGQDGVDEDNVACKVKGKVGKNKYANNKRTKKSAREIGVIGGENGGLEGSNDLCIVKDKVVKRKYVFKKKRKALGNDSENIIDGSCKVKKREKVNKESSITKGQERVVKRKYVLKKKSKAIDRGTESVVEELCEGNKMEEIDKEKATTKGRDKVVKRRYVVKKKKSKVVARVTKDVHKDDTDVEKVSERYAENDAFKEQDKVLKRKYTSSKAKKAADKDCAVEVDERGSVAKGQDAKRRCKAAKKTQAVVSDNGDANNVVTITNGSAEVVSVLPECNNRPLQALFVSADEEKDLCVVTNDAHLDGHGLVSRNTDDAIREIVAKEESGVKKETVGKIRDTLSKKRHSGVKDNEELVRQKSAVEQANPCLLKREKMSKQMAAVLGADREEERCKGAPKVLTGAAKNSPKRNTNRFFDITSKVTQKDREKMAVQRRKTSISLVEQVFSTMEAQDQKEQKEHTKSCKNGPSSKKVLKSEEEEEEEQRAEVDDNAETLWLWDGESSEQTIQLQLEGEMVTKTCYPAIRHANDDVVIRVLDCVMLRSGDQQPYLAKITAFYFDEETGKKMMAVLWYYRPEHTDQGRLLWHSEADIYASKHLDTNSVDCIEDKAFVLPAELYCRFVAYQKRVSTSSRQGLTARLVPVVPEEALLPDLDQESKAASTEPTMAMFVSHFYYTSNFQTSFPPEMTASNVFVCRGLYDLEQHKVTRNVLQMVLSPIKEQPERCRSVDSAMSISSCNSEVRADLAAAAVAEGPSPSRPSAPPADRGLVTALTSLIVLLPPGHGDPRRALLPSPPGGLKVRVAPSLMVQHNGR